jgi:hypothetical protein
MMLPYTLTGQDDVIGLPTRHVLSIVESMSDAALGFSEEISDTPTDEVEQEEASDQFSL